MAAPSGSSRWTPTSRTTRAYLPRLIEATERADLAIGSATSPAAAITDWGPMRRFISRGGSAYARAALGLPVRDLTGGFKCFRRIVLETIDLETIEARGYAFQVETTYRAIKAGFRVVEVPIVFKRPHGRDIEDEQGGSSPRRCGECRQCASGAGSSLHFV